MSFLRHTVLHPPGGATAAREGDAAVERRWSAGAKGANAATARAPADERRCRRRRKLPDSPLRQRRTSE